MGLQPTHGDAKHFPAVILSDERSEESKDPYTAHPLSSGVIFDGAKPKGVKEFLCTSVSLW
jgi:hypothetical protein